MKRYLETVLRYWYLVLIPIILFPSGEFVLLKQASKTITASQTVYVSSSVQSQLDSPNLYISPADNLSAAVAQLLQSQDFAGVVAGRSPHLLTTERASSALAQADFAAHLQVKSNGNYLTVSYTTRDRVGADVAALEVVQGFLSSASTEIQQLHRSSAYQSISSIKQQLIVALSQQTRDEKAYGAYLRRAGLTDAQARDIQLSDPTAGDLIQQVSSDNDVVASLRKSLVAPQQGQQGVPQSLYTIFDRPTIFLDATTKTKQLVSLGIAAGLGIVLAALFIVVRTALDRTIRFPSEVARLLDLPVLTVVPYSHQPLVSTGSLSRLASPPDSAAS